MEMVKGVVAAVGAEVATEVAEGLEAEGRRLPKRSRTGNRLFLQSANKNKCWRARNYNNNNNNNNNNKSCDDLDPWIERQKGESSHQIEGRG